MGTSFPALELGKLAKTRQYLCLLGLPCQEFKTCLVLGNKPTRTQAANCEH